MPLDLFINLDSPSVKTALRANTSSRRPADAPEFVLGKTQPVRVYFINDAGEIQTQAGVVKLALARKSKNPSSGTFKISIGGETTEEIDYNASANDIEDALNELDYITNAGGVTVTGIATAFKVQFNEVGANSSLILDLTDLSPRMTGLVSTITTGDSDTAGLYFCQISAQILTLADTYDSNPDHYVFDLDLTTTNLLEAINQGAEADVILEFKIGDEILLQTDAKILFPNINNAVYNDPVLTGTYADAAQTSATNAATSATNAAQSATEAYDHSQIALGYSDSASSSAETATLAATNAAASALDAGDSATDSYNQAQAALGYSDSASYSASEATSAAQNAQISAVDAEGSSTAAQAQVALAAAQVALATTQANNSLSSASSASTSAAQAALIAAGLVYKGVIAGASVPSTSTSAGDFYVITSAGTSQSKTWGILDLAIYKGSSGQWDQVVYSTITGGYIDPIAVSRQGILGMAYSDGATSNRRIEWTMGTAGNIAGSSLSEVGHLLRVPTSNPASRAALFFYSSSSTPADVYATAHTLVVFLETNGSLIIRNIGNPVTDIRSATYAGFRAAYSGQLIRLDFVFTSSIANPAIYVNGIDVSSSFTFASGGTPPDWIHTGLLATYRVALFNWPALEAKPGAPINRALTAAEITQMVQTAALVPRDRAGGSQVPAYQSNFATTDSFNAVNSGTVGASGGKLQIGSVSSNSTSGATRTNTAVVFGQVYELVLTAQVTAGTAGNWDISDSNSALGLVDVATATTPRIAATLSAQTFTLHVRRNSGTAIYIKRTGAEDSTLEITSMVFKPIGALIQPEFTRTSQLLDQGANRNRGQMTAGIRPLCDRDPVGFEFVLTSTGAFLTGASTNPLFFESGFITEIWAFTDTAGADLTLRNNSSSTNNLVTALTDIPTANQWTRLTLIDAQRAVSSGSTLWGSSSAGTIRIRGQWSRT